MLDDPISRSYELIRKQEDGDSMSVDISEEMNDTGKRKVKQDSPWIHCDTFQHEMSDSTQHLRLALTVTHLLLVALGSLNVLVIFLILSRP
ncbi:hypothetical protein ANCDUO_00597 [Ancylostoma duodenale]|uniref:Uncharacterized protein n=1 Tax=Ancylostoma duodenale TaxID=51022 RepID=A0A0C2H5F1_9BILA|nr:hypothetical protein ANCDUO_00597 [Ancylostoma duodenale]